MIVYESQRYRIESHTNTPLRFSVDYKEQLNNRICLVNLGWRNWLHQAYELMNNHLLEKSNDGAM